VVVAKDRNCEGRCRGLYEAASFEGTFYGFSVGSPIGGSFNNTEEFEDDWGESHNVQRIEGPSGIHSGRIALHRWGKSVGYYEFGELRSPTNISDVDQGYDLGVDKIVGNIVVKEIFCVESWDFQEAEMPRH
jgi:hypothetical protein